MSQDYKVVGVINKPTPEFVAMIADQPNAYRAKLVSQGRIAVQLGPSRQEPPQPALDLASDSQALSTIYHIPDYLAGEDVTYRLRALEFGKLGLCAYVVASAKGKPLAPLYTTPHLWAGDWHVGSVFVYQRMSRAACFLEGTQMSLTIDRAVLQLNDGIVAVRRQILLPAASVGASIESVQLPAQLAAWKPAVTALYERLHCRKKSCGSHYCS